MPTKKNILQLSQEINDLGQRARDGKLKPEEMKGRQLQLQILAALVVPMPPQLLIIQRSQLLECTKIVDKPVMKDGKFPCG